MQITVDVPEDRIRRLVAQRIDELFGDDARYRESRVRDLVRTIVDETAAVAVIAARDAIRHEFVQMAQDAVSEATRAEIAAAAKRGLAALRKLFAGFDPAKLTPEQRKWVEKQIADSAGGE
jgi:DNA invertase Pin-like site-specific DNA recombinase